MSDQRNQTRILFAVATVLGMLTMHGLGYVIMTTELPVHPGFLEAVRAGVYASGAVAIVGTVGWWWAATRPAQS